MARNDVTHETFPTHIANAEDAAFQWAVRNDPPSWTHGANAIGGHIEIRRLTNQPLIFNVDHSTTVDEVARRFGISPQAIMQANDLASMRLAKHQQIEIPTWTTHTIEANDTLTDLSRRFGRQVEDIAYANDLQPDATLRIGDVLAVPDPGAAVNNGGHFHRVKRGESFWSLTRKFDVIEDELRYANGMGARDDGSLPVLRQGQYLYVPDVPVHYVKRGESLSEIRRRYGVTLDQLRAFNDLKGDTIQPGQRLGIPTSGPWRISGASLADLQTTLESYGFQLLPEIDDPASIIDRHGERVPSGADPSNFVRAEDLVGSHDGHAVFFGIIAPDGSTSPIPKGSRLRASIQDGYVELAFQAPQDWGDRAYFSLQTEVSPVLSKYALNFYRAPDQRAWDDVAGLDVLKEHLPTPDEPLAYYAVESPLPGGPRGMLYVDNNNENPTALVSRAAVNEGGEPWMFDATLANEATHVWLAHQFSDVDPHTVLTYQDFSNQTSTLAYFQGNELLSDVASLEIHNGRLATIFENLIQSPPKGLGDLYQYQGSTRVAHAKLVELGYEADYSELRSKNADLDDAGQQLYERLSEPEREEIIAAIRAEGVAFLEALKALERD